MTRAIYKDPTGLDGVELTLAHFINRVGQIVRYPGRLMGAIDNLNMGMGYQADLQARTYLMAAQEADAQGLAGDARDAFMAKRTTALRADPPAEVKAKSMDAGLYQSFQEAPRTRFGERISSALNLHPLVKLIVAPFVHRPLNMLRQSLMDYTALGLASRTTRDTLAAANADSDVAMARMLLGTAALTYGYHLADAGYLTGERNGSNNTELLDGIPRDAIKIGGTWHQFNRLDPVGTWLAVSADLHEALARGYDPNNSDTLDQFGRAARSAIQVVGAAAMDKSFMQSVSQFFDMLGSRDPKRTDVFAQNFIDSNVGKLVPFSGALRTVRREQDTTERASGGDGLSHVWDSVKGNLPVLSKQLPAKLDLLGRPVQYPGGNNGWWNPFAGTTANTDHMDQELSTLAVAVREPPRTLAGVTLTPEQYSEVVNLATKTPMFNGMNLEGYLRALTDSDEWKSYESTNDHGVAAHTKMVQDAVDAAYSAGRQLFIQNHRDFVAQMYTNQQAQAQHFVRQ